MISISDKEFNQIASFIHSRYGIHLKQEKQSLVSGRLHQVLMKQGFSNFSDYYDYLINDRTGEAVNTLIDKMTTNHTFFMREPEHFKFFSDHVLPYLTNNVKDRDLRIWSAACSTGEEPYTLAMILDTLLGKEKAKWDAKILATDISDEVLESARKGMFGNDRIKPLPVNWRLQYFTKHGDEQSIVADHIRKEVIFRKLNLMDARFPFKRKFHVIFCRNVMIYFDNQTKDELTEKLYDLIEVGGYLFIGQSESLNRGSTRFKYVMPSVYRKI